MITGEITARREASIRLQVGSQEDMMRDLEAAIDTGFTRYLTLPPEVVAELGLRFRQFVRFVLANTSVVDVAAYDAIVEWHGQLRNVIVYEVHGGLLVGMSMLYGSRVTLDVVDGGLITIEAIA